jgi:hypothetical protein
MYTDKKEKKIFLIYKEIQSGAVAGLPNIQGGSDISGPISMLHRRVKK